MRRRLRHAPLLVLLSITGSGIAADYQTGYRAYTTGDYATALSEWQPLAEQGDANGQFGLGLLYANGFGVDLNDDAALKWYRLAADQGHAEAAYNLGVMYANGWGVTQSDAEAFKLYSVAAERGITAAQISLGKMHAVGFGAPQDNVKALMWYAIAAMLEDMNAEFDRDELASMMSADDIAKAEQLAKQWLTQFRSGKMQ